MIMLHGHSILLDERGRDKGTDRLLMLGVSCRCNALSHLSKPI